MPQVSPVAVSEVPLNDSYVRRSVSAVRSSIRFRNELRVFHDYFPGFKRLSEESWPRLQIQELASGRGEQRNELELYVRDEDFVGDIRWMGHGLQIWLQTMWFLARVDHDDVIVLDEPDVYLHADLQRKLIRILKRQDRQSVIATHSVERMAEVDPSCILVADRRRRRSQFATSLPAVQEVIDHVGGVHNIQLARLWNYKKVIYVEGDDVALLKIFQDKLFPTSGESLDVIPNFVIGGWGGWGQVIGSSKTFKDGGGENIAKYCVLDRDYHTNEELNERQESATAHNIRLHIWSRKEIENYVIVPAAIKRHINTKKRKGSRVNIGYIENKLDEICEALRDETLDLLSQQYIFAHHPRNPSEGNRYARAELSQRWTSLSGKVGVVRGKSVLSRVSEWTQRDYGIGVNAHTLARNMAADELGAELTMVINAIENGIPFT
jgi:energy-coupling factor transporter ATP-binding protein EcfA2